LELIGATVGLLDLAADLMRQGQLGDFGRKRGLLAGLDPLTVKRKPCAAMPGRTRFAVRKGLVDPSLDPTGWHGLLSLRIDPRRQQPESGGNPHCLVQKMTGRHNWRRLSRQVP